MKPEQERWAGVAAGVLVIVSAFLPWASIRSIFGTLSVSGADGGDGQITAVLGVLVALVALRGGKVLWAGIVAGVVIAGVGLLDMADVQSMVDDVNSDPDTPAIASVGLGLYGTIAGGVGAIITCWLPLGRLRRARSASSVPTAIPLVPPMAPPGETAPEWPPPPQP